MTNWSTRIVTAQPIRRSADVMSAAEAVRLGPDAAAAALEAQKRILERLNMMDS